MLRKDKVLTQCKQKRITLNRRIDFYKEHLKTIEANFEVCNLKAFFEEGCAHDIQVHKMLSFICCCMYVWHASSPFGFDSPFL